MNRPTLPTLLLLALIAVVAALYLAFLIAMADPNRAGLLAPQSV